MDRNISDSRIKGVSTGVSRLSYEVFCCDGVFTMLWCCHVETSCEIKYYKEEDNLFYIHPYLQLYKLLIGVFSECNLIQQYNVAF